MPQEKNDTKVYIGFEYALVCAFTALNKVLKISVRSFNEENNFKSCLIKQR